MKKKRRRIILVGTAVIMFLVAGPIVHYWNNHEQSFPSKRAKNAIRQVLHENAMAVSCDTPDNTLSGIMTIVGRRRSIDTSKCPDDFRSAYKRYVLAWDKMLDQFLSNPKIVEDELFKPLNELDIDIAYIALGGSVVDSSFLTRIHAMVQTDLIDRAVASLEDDFLTMESVSEDLKDVYLKNDDEARSSIVRAAELGVINSSDILPVYREFKSPSHVEFREPTRWSLLNSITEIVKKYSPQRVDHSYLALNRAFGLDGRPAALFA